MKSIFKNPFAVGAIVILVTTVVLYFYFQSKKFHSRYFEPSEFDSPDAPGSGVNMENSFIKMLDDTREQAGFPFVVVSGYRTLEHNAAVGGVNDSAHTLGLAADIQATTPGEQQAIVDAWLTAGGTRYGIGNTFVHLDNDDSKPQYAAWGYPSEDPWYNPKNFA